MNFTKPFVAFVLAFVLSVRQSIVECIARHTRKRIGTVASTPWNPQQTKASRILRKLGFHFTVFSIFFTFGAVFTALALLICYLL